jgi:hypothetical protein
MEVPSPGTVAHEDEGAIRADDKQGGRGHLLDRGCDAPTPI